MAIKYKKRCLIDWISFTTSKFLIKKEYLAENYTILESPELMEFLAVFGLNEIPPIQLNGKNGYKNMLLIGEHIQVLFGSPFIKDNSGNYVSQILMSGQACREFENHYDVGWQKLLSILSSIGQFKRVDIAIDDFDGKEISIYEIEKLMREGFYVSRFNYRNFNISERVSGEEVYSDGFTITLGKRPGNQLCIYDKRKERDSKREYDLPTDIWYRYEMRITDERADQLVREYLLGLNDNDSKTFMNIACQILVDFLDLKDNTNLVKNKSRLPRHHKWQKFLGSVEKINLKIKHKIDPTIKSQQKWFNQSISQMLACFYLADEHYDKFQVENISYGLSKMYLDRNYKKLAIVNNYRSSVGLKPLTLGDVQELSEYFNDIINEYTYDNPSKVKRNIENLRAKK